MFQEKIANMYTSLSACRSYLYTIAKSCDAGYTNKKDCAAVILNTSEFATKAALEAIQILGKSFGLVANRPRTLVWCYSNCFRRERLHKRLSCRKTLTRCEIIRDWRWHQWNPSNGNQQSDCPRVFIKRFNAIFLQLLGLCRFYESQK